MNQYQFILDEKILKDFVEWLPELEREECYYVVALARNKYVRDIPGKAMPHIASDKQQIARFLCGKKSIFNRIKQLECAVGSYKTKTGEDVPQESIATYISVNPRSYVSGAKNALKVLADLITQNYNGYRTDHEVISAVQTSCSRKIFMDIDFDGVDLDSTMEIICQKINADCLTVLKTRGGFHLLIKLAEIDPQYKKSWYNEIIKLPGADVRGDNLIPIPGSSQGMFVPELLSVCDDPFGQYLGLAKMI